MVNNHAPGPGHIASFRVARSAIYEPLPDDWLIGVTDIVDSTPAIKSGRYEDVNYAGASIIAALGNAWGTFDFRLCFVETGPHLPCRHRAS